MATQHPFTCTSAVHLILNGVNYPAPRLLLLPSQSDIPISEPHREIIKYGLLADGVCMCSTLGTYMSGFPGSACNPPGKTCRPKLGQWSFGESRMPLACIPLLPCAYGNVVRTLGRLHGGQSGKPNFEGRLSAIRSPDATFCVRAMQKYCKRSWGNRGGGGKGKGGGKREGKGEGK